MKTHLVEDLTDGECRVRLAVTVIDLTTGMGIEFVASPCPSEVWHAWTAIAEELSQLEILKNIRLGYRT